MQLGERLTTGSETTLVFLYCLMRKRETHRIKHTETSEMKKSKQNPTHSNGAVRAADLSIRVLKLLLGYTSLVLIWLLPNRCCQGVEGQWAGFGMRWGGGSAFRLPIPSSAMLSGTRDAADSAARLQPNKHTQKESKSKQRNLQCKASMGGGRERMENQTSLHWQPLCKPNQGFFKTGGFLKGVGGNFHVPIHRIKKRKKIQFGPMCVSSPLGHGGLVRKDGERGAAKYEWKDTGVAQETIDHKQHTNHKWLWRWSGHCSG